ncbi:PREDICTED: protein disulfide isomerase-like 5-4 isoform X1 [Ipomoea nil]|uniref:protein disulfide isomerase-like 5-4 isoform X1 n=1 Tax=Ipomoea nil TaxID=35883 RepID=UPI000900A8AC|nr:PREDICTED: protein disulfide isomerase-like 5-4 isoform X1 [Ipomoea nil]
MTSKSKIKSVDFYRKIPRDLTEASLTGAGLSIIAAFFMILLFGMELNDYLTMSTTTSVIVDKSSDGDFLIIDFDMSFPALSCEFASVDVSDVLGTNRLNITKTVRKYSIDSNLRHTGSEFETGSIANAIKHDEDVDEEYTEGSISLTGRNFDRVAHRFPILVVNFFAPWCHWSNRLKPSWEKAENIIRERYDPEMDGRILLGKVDCTEEVDLCTRNHIQGYPSIRIYRKGSDLREADGHNEHESYYGDRDTESLVKTMEELVAPISLESQRVSSDAKLQTNGTKRPAPTSGGCRIEGFVRVKKVPGNLVISAHSAAHSFDASQMNMSHVISHFSFGKRLSQQAISDMKKFLPYLGQSYDKLSSNAYITNPKESNENVTIEHYLQVVKTEVMTGTNKVVEDYEYTSHSSLVHSLDIPVAKFHYEPSPMQVLITETAKSFSHFLTNVCAIIGGVFTVAGILDSLLLNTLRLVKKVELGKNF